MDKQIIDSIDVKKCVYNESGYCTISKEAYCYCCDKPNCHYKNWQRKEQECERLKNERTIDLVKQLDQLKAENETYKKMLEDENVQLALTEIRSGERHLWFNKAEKLKQTLTEIKEIAEPYQKDIDKICGNCSRYDGCHACCMDTLNNYEYRTGTTKACDKFIELKDFDINKLANQILQKISECEGSDD